MMDSSSDEAEAAANRYQSLFLPDVAGISSRDLLSDSLCSSPSTSKCKWSFHGHNVLLVDVRTDSERGVSMISGAVSLNDFKTNVLPSLQAKSEDSALPDMIMTYCTIGYRSGVEGRKLINDYPDIFVGFQNDDKGTLEEGRSRTVVGNLDGIIPFANASLEHVSGELTTTIEPLIIDRKTKTATKRVHVYGPSWKKYLNPNYDAITFSRLEFAWRGLSVLFRSFLSNFLSCTCCKS